MIIADHLQPFKVFAMEQQSADMETLLEGVDPEEEDPLFSLLDQVDQKDQNSFELRNRIDELEFDNVELQYQLRNHQSLANGCFILDSEYQALKDSSDNMALDLQSKTEQIELFKFSIGDIGEFYAKLQGKAVKLRKQGRFYESITYFKRAIALEKATNNRASTLAWLNCWIAKTYYQWTNYDQAIEFCNKSISHSPGMRASIMLRAEALYDLEQYEDARKDLEQILDKSTDDQKAVELMKACERRMRYRK